MALHDEGTGLPNRTLLTDRLDSALSAGRRHGTAIAVLLIEVGSSGSSAASPVLADDRTGLSEVGRRLAGAVRDGDTAARVGDGKFVVLCQDLPLEAPAILQHRVAAVSQRIGRTLRAPLRLPDTVVQLPVTISVTFTGGNPGGRATAARILAGVDQAIGRPASARPARQPAGVDVADPGPDDRHGAERDLASALERGELLVYYQPIVALDGHGVRDRARARSRDARDGTHHVAAVEALLRWRCAPDVVLPASTFIGLAVDSGVIHSLGRWVIDETCAQLRRWREILGDRAPDTAFVNLSCPELADDDLPGTVSRALERHGLSPHHLGLEIVEEDLGTVETLPRLAHYHERGHPLAVDDFGTGYSSLSRLLDVPVDLVKIDRSFLRNVPHDPRRAALIDAVLGVADSLDLQVIAEGVETEEQFLHLRAAGCQFLQGFFLGRPARAADLTRMFASTASPASRTGRRAASDSI